MRASLLRSRSLAAAKRALPCSSPSIKAQRVLFSYSQAARYPRQQRAAPRATSRTLRRSSSSPSPAPAPSEPPLPSSSGTEQAVSASGGRPPSVPPPEEPEENLAAILDEVEPEKPSDAEKARRTRRTKAEIEAEATSSFLLPSELDILWTPNRMEEPSPSALPPPEIFEEVLTDLLITLHPQTQHRSAYAQPSSSSGSGSASSSGSLIEPTLGLYCPFEGGDYIIDETVRELARRTDSDVVVIDAVQLAAGQAGCFGKAASVLQLPQNPLHFRAPIHQSPSLSPIRRAQEDDYDRDEGDEDGPIRDFQLPAAMSIHVMSPPGGRSSRQALSTPTTRSPMSKTKSFFEELINTPSPKDAEAVAQGKRRSRLIYIRDYPTLAPTASTWYPPLLAAVRQRRQGPIARSTSPVANSTTIVFGMTPPLVQPSAPSYSGGPGLLGLLNAWQSAPPVLSHPPRSGKSDYGEGEYAEKARERRLRDRLRKWERDEPAFYDEMPRSPYAGETMQEGNERPGFVLVGSPFSNLPTGPPGNLLSALQNRANGHGDDSEDNSQFFRLSVLVPSIRNHGMERQSRTSRRREINELTMRMALHAIGGNVETRFALPEPPMDAESTSETNNKADQEFHNVVKMWEEWGRSVEAWKNVKDIADRAVATVVAQDMPHSKPSLDTTTVPWSAVVSAWAARSSIRETRKAWLQESAGKGVKHILADDLDDESSPIRESDEVIQRVKEDADLTSHEQRLLGCIVDAASMTTSFDQVHLPPQTIDAVRTIVSLPLLHPTAFQQGILKQHSMTGCLLFGPPGTGKTLVVRALARDAGCRMLSVQPSDVMDMYVGEGEKLVRSLFSLARRLSPCVVFLDEIDALFGARSSARETGGTLAHHGIITEFMQEMDGLKTRSDSNVIVIGATNRPFDLDDAVLRRLPRRLLVDLPGEKERESILKILLRDEVLADDVDLVWLAKRTELFSGSDLKHLCVSAALDAVKENISLPWAMSSSEPAKELKPLNDTSVSSEEAEPSESGASAETEEEESTDKAAVREAAEQELLSATEASDGAPRTLYLRHFTKALKEISPSSSESLGTLSALRKWNEEFGEGQKKKAKKMWGKGAFGFMEPGTEVPSDGRVSAP
ncbi:hypothetical protein ACEPAG_5225 [Sanghuangporus baumii]